MNRAAKARNKDERPPPPRSPVSSFLWSGLVCVLASAFIGVNAIVSAMQKQSDVPLDNLIYALLILLCSVPLFYAQARYLFWRRASGVMHLHTSLTAAPIEIKTKSLRTEHLEPWLVYSGLILLAILPRYFSLQPHIFATEMPLFRFFESGTSLSDPAMQAYAFLGKGLLALRNLLEGSALSETPLSLGLMRFPAFVGGVCAVPMLYLTVRILLGRPIALASALMLALSPEAVAASGKASNVPLVLFFALGQGYCLARAVRDCEANAWIGWLVCTILGTLLAPAFWILVALDAIFILIRSVWASSRMRLPAQGAALIEQTIVLGAAYAAFAFAISYAWGEHLALPPFRLPLLAASKLFVGNFDTLFSGVVILIGLIALVLRPSALAVYVALVGVLGWGISGAVLVAPLLLMLLASGLDQVLRWIMGGVDTNLLRREAALYLLTLVWIGFHLPHLHDAMEPRPIPKKRAATVVTASPSRGARK